MIAPARIGLVTLTSVAALLLPFPSAGQKPGVPAIVDQVVQAYGGSGVLEAVGALRLEGTITAHPRREQGTFRRSITGPGSMDVRLQYPSTTEIRVLSEWKGFRGSDPDHLTEVEGPLLGAMRLQGARASVPWILLGMKDALRVVAVRTEDVVLEGDLAPGLTLRFFIHRGTHRVTRSESEVRVGATVIPFSTDYADFRKVRGVLVAHLEETHASGVHTATTRVERVTVEPAR